MRSWKVRQLRLQLEFLLFFFFFIPYSADNFSLASVPTHHGTMPSWCSVSWAFKIFPSSSTKYIPTICYTKAPRLVIQCSQGCQASNWLQSAVGSDEKKYNQNAMWSMRHRGAENLSVILTSLSSLPPPHRQPTHPLCVTFPLLWMKLPPKQPFPSQCLQPRPLLLSKP